MQREDTQHAPATRVHAQSRNMASPASRDKEKAHKNRRAHTGARRLGSLPTEADPPLLRVLLKEAVRRKHHLNEMALSLGVTYGYISQLRRGIRQCEHISQEFALACSRYLGVPAALVKLWAGRIRADDFVWPNKAADQALADGFARMVDDPTVLGLMPEELLSASPPIKRFVVNLFHECVDAHPRSLRAMPTALDYLQRAALNEADFEARLAELRGELERPAEL
jgi:hypothetical protein